jgi:release factor glutamine methyltransferase
VSTPDPAGYPREVWTPLRVLQWAVPHLQGKGVGSPRLDVECLLAQVLGCDRLRVYLQHDRPLSDEEKGWLRDRLSRRARREPLAYLLGRREFYGLDFEVDPAVLIPRPETEMLVEQAREILEGIPVQSRRLLDLGTGSGCLAVSLAALVPGLQVWATDRSGSALETAQRNAVRHGVQDRVRFLKGDWWAALQGMGWEPFPVIVSNPPYLSEQDREGLAPEVRDFEPSEALFPGLTGLEAYERVGLDEHLTPGGWVLLEMNDRLHQGIAGLWAGWGRSEVRHDLQGLPRVLRLQKAPFA